MGIDDSDNKTTIAAQLCKSHLRSVEGRRCLLKSQMRFEIAAAFWKRICGLNFAGAIFVSQVRNWHRSCGAQQDFDICWDCRPFSAKSLLEAMAWLILGLRPANERRRYFAMTYRQLTPHPTTHQPTPPPPPPHNVSSCISKWHGTKQYWVVHDEVIKWKHFPRYCPFVRGIHRSRWIPHTKASDAERWCFLWSAPE